MSLLRAVARLYPWSAGASDDLRRALAFLSVDADPDDVVRAGYVVGIPAALAAGALGWSIGVPWWALPGVGAAAWLATAHAVHRAPVVAAAAERTRAVGAAADIVALAVLRMRIDPTAERAARFAARTGRGPLAASLSEHVRRARGRASSGLPGFAAEWSTWFPALEDAVELVEAAGRAPPEERDRTLDRATETVIEGTRDRIAAFSEEIRPPAAAVYAFGVLLPLALVGTLPAARVAGIRVTVPAVVVGYDLLLPAVLGAASVRLLVRRPAAFPPPRVSRSHPDVPDDWRWLAAGVLAGGVAWPAAARFVAPWSAPVAAAGTGIGVALFVRYRPMKRVRDRARAAEERLDDALHLIGGQVAEGASVEAALPAAAESVGGETGRVLEATTGVRRRLRTTVSDALLGDHGVLATLPSPRLRGAAALLALAAREGRPAGEVIVAMGDHLAEVRRVEAEGRRELARVTGTLANTAAVFGPLVAGATVALSSSVATGEPGLGPGTLGRGLPAAALGPAIGAYVLLMAAILTMLATGLERGIDPPLIGYRVGVALPAATATYLVAVVGAGLVL
ncbi:MAG: type II secretion system protein [Haloferacaceae archaeon]